MRTTQSSSIAVRFKAEIVPDSQLHWGAGTGGGNARPMLDPEERATYPADMQQLKYRQMAWSGVFIPAIPRCLWYLR